MLKFYKLVSLVSAVTMAVTIVTAPALNNSCKVSASSVTSNRISGQNRYETAAKIADEGWKTSSDYAIIATGENFPDALCAAPLAKMYNAPILLTGKDSLNEITKAELQKLNVYDAIIVGGTGVVSQNTEDQIDKLGIYTERIAGINRYETSERVAERIGPSNKVIVTTGTDFPDALSIAPIAAMKGMPILLTSKNTLPDETKSYLDDDNPDSAYVVGGSGVVSDTVLRSLKNPRRLSGANRYETNAAVLNEFINDLNLSKIYISTGKNFPDALACSALAPTTSSPMILTGGKIDNSIQSFITINYGSINSVNAIGGTGAVSDDDINSIAADFIDDPISFKDKNLEKAVREAINKPFGDIIKNEVINIKSLRTDGNGVSDLTGIENLQNLQSLDLSISDSTMEQVTDITPLKPLTNLHELNLSGNFVTDISALKGASNLQILNLNHNQINNPDILASFTNLQYLNLDGNTINDTSFLKNLSGLQYLNLSDNSISDISDIKSLTNLSTLYLNNNNISDISALAGLTSLSSLFLSNNQISDLSPIKDLKYIQYLDLNYNQISDVVSLEGLTTLVSLNLSGNSISDESKNTLISCLPHCSIKF